MQRWGHKGQNGRDLTEAEYTKKKWQEYTELCKKKKKMVFMTQIIMMV